MIGSESANVLVQLGPVTITRAVVTTWGIMLGLGLFSWLSTRRLALFPGRRQIALEAIVTAIGNAIGEVLPQHTQTVFPFIATLWIFIAVANIIGIIPGLDSPTGDLSLTTALALLVFLSVHWFGIRTQGLRPYLRHYLQPTPILLPFHIISEISRTVALAIRLFGNMMSMEMAVLLVLLVAGLFMPIPLLMLHILEGIVQAYIFGMLALIFIAGALQSQQRESNNRQEPT